MNIMGDDQLATRDDDAGREAFELTFHWWQEHRRYMAELQAVTGLSPMEVHAVRALQAVAAMPTVTLAQQIHCEPSNITSVVDRLVRAGLVERTTSDEDRRIRLVTLTEAGRRMRDTIQQRLATPPAAITRLSADDQRLLRDLLRRMLAPE